MHAALIVTPADALVAEAATALMAIAGPKSVPVRSMTSPPRVDSACRSPELANEMDVTDGRAYDDNVEGE